MCFSSICVSLLGEKGRVSFFLGGEREVQFEGTGGGDTKNVCVRVFRPWIYNDYVRLFFLLSFPRPRLSISITMQ